MWVAVCWLYILNENKTIYFHSFNIKEFYFKTILYKQNKNICKTETQCTFTIIILSNTRITLKNTISHYYNSQKSNNLSEILYKHYPFIISQEAILLCT